MVKGHGFRATQLAWMIHVAVCLVIKILPRHVLSLFRVHDLMFKSYSLTFFQTQELRYWEMLDPANLLAARTGLFLLFVCR